MHRGICGAYHPRSGHCPRRGYHTRRRSSLGGRGFADAIPTRDLHLPLPTNCSSFVPPLLGVISSLTPTHGGNLGLILRREPCLPSPRYSAGAGETPHKCETNFALKKTLILPLCLRAFVVNALLLKHQLLFLSAACPRLLVPHWGAGVPLRSAKVSVAIPEGHDKLPTESPRRDQGSLLLVGYRDFAQKHAGFFSYKTRTDGILFLIHSSMYIGTTNRIQLGYITGCCMVH
jgi:hypothetical protein